MQEALLPLSARIPDTQVRSPKNANLTRFNQIHGGPPNPLSEKSDPHKTEVFRCIPLHSSYLLDKFPHLTSVSNASFGNKSVGKPFKLFLTNVR
jgi:hypothetical protein